MDAQLKKIQITPTKYDKEGEIDKERFATLTFEVPLGDTAQRKAVAELMEASDQEFMQIACELWQQRLEEAA